MDDFIRAIIVDDDRVARNLLSSLVDWAAHGFALLGEAADGQEALALCRDLRPDLIFLDVSMPHMDGIELMQALDELRLGAHIVVVSSYSDYQFVREVFRLGAVDYLLKDDLNAPRFVRLLDEVKAKLIAGRRHHSDAQAGDAPAPNVDDSRPMSLLLCGFPFFRRYADADNGVDGGLLSRSIQSFIAQLLDGAQPHPPRWVQPGVLCLPVLDAGDGELERRIRQCMLTYLDMQVEIVRIDALARDLEAACAQAMHLLLGDPADDGWKVPLDRLLRALDRRDIAGAVVEMDALREAVKRRSPHLCAAEAVAEMVMDGLNRCGVDAADLHPDHMESVDALFDWMHDLLAQRLSAGDGCCPHVRRAIDYIQAHYHQSITLGKVARHVHVAPSYLSTSFHHDTGVTFVEYLNRLRIAEARKLLMQPGSSVKDIYHRVGFNNYNYFFKVYRQVTGQSPAGSSHSAK